jgi:hypothetical protein
MQLGDCSTAGSTQRSPLDAALNEAQQALSSMIELLEGGGLEQLSPEEKLTWWHRFETFRNQLPLVDHSLIADAEASDLADSYGFSSMTRFLVRILQLSAGTKGSAPVRPVGGGCCRSGRPSTCR